MKYEDKQTIGTFNLELNQKIYISSEKTAELYLISCSEAGKLSFKKL